jgi:hypothetical protein
MLQLGYAEYVTQGGDWGFLVTRALGALYPESCKASHVNMIPVFPPKWKSNPLLALQNSVTPFSKRDQAGLERSEWFKREGFGEILEFRS